MARRGWLEARHVLNTQPWEAIAERRARRLRDHGDPSWRVVPRVISLASPSATGLEPEAEVDRAETRSSAEHAWGDEGLEPAPRSGPGSVSPSHAAKTADADAGEVASLAQTLAAGLGGGPLDEATRARLGAWLVAGAEDPTLQAALARVSDNPLQAGFDLLTTGD
jgi:hypothetical protein